MLTISFIIGSMPSFTSSLRLAKTPIPVKSRKGCQAVHLLCLHSQQQKLCQAFSICLVKRDHVNPIARLLST